VTPFDRLVAELRALETRTDEGARAWQLLLDERERTTAGAKDREIGGVYAPPIVRRELQGELLVHWKDGRLSRTNVDALFLRDPAASLRRVRARAYEEKFVPDLPEDRDLPSVRVHDPGLARVARGDASPALDLLHALAPRLPNVEASFSAEVEATAVARRIANSKGLDRSSETTLASFWTYADGLFGVGAERRDLAALESARPRVDLLNEWLPRFRETPRDATSGRRTVVLLPGTAQSFLAHYLIQNLDGEAVANGQSAWARDDFDAKRAVFAPDLDVRFDPLEDWRSWSYRIDRRGLPAERRAFVEAGRLSSPVVSLKAAKQLSCAPSPAPPAIGLALSASRRADLERFVAGLDDGVLVPSVLGIHTQDAARGTYSLSVPRALVVRNGRIAGAAKAVIAGNFLEDLRGDVTAIESPLMDGGGLAFATSVVFA
jgi:PmbA protein